MRMRLIATAVLAAAAAVGLARCGGGSNPAAPGGTTGGGVGATITIRADGTIDPVEVNIAIGQRVRFVNQDSRQHQPTSNPHLQHTDCPALNLPILAAGQAMNTGVFEITRTCGFHDHINPDTPALYGTIRVGGAAGPAGPVYVRQ